MTPLPNYRPKQLSLGPLETEILHIIWLLGSATVKEIHERLIAGLDRELTYASVTTVLRRLTEKGWLVCDKTKRTFSWQPLVSRSEAQVLEAYEQLQRFLAVGHPDIVAAFADSLEEAIYEQIEAIALHLKAIRQAKENQQ